jgi:hypothetical protein
MNKWEIVALILVILMAAGIYYYSRLHVDRMRGIHMELGREEIRQEAIRVGVAGNIITSEYGIAKFYWINSDRRVILAKGTQPKSYTE